MRVLEWKLETVTLDVNLKREFSGMNCFMLLPLVQGHNWCLSLSFTLQAMCF